MKRIIALFLLVSLIFSGCNFGNESNEKTTTYNNQSTTSVVQNTTVVEETTVDPDLSVANPDTLNDLEEKVYSEVVDSLDDDYYVQDVKAVYLSQEYIEEAEYNLKENVFFGYSLSQLNEQFKGKKYCFTVGEDGNTIVKEVEPYDDTNDVIIRDVAIGTGVILVSVAIAAVSAGAGAPVVAAVFAASAKGAAIGAFSGALFDGTIAGVTTAIETDGNKDEILKSVKLEAASGFKMGAIIGGVTGGVSKAMSIKKATSAGLKAKDVVLIQKESKWSSKTIKGIKNMDEYNVYKRAGLKEVTINGDKALVKNNYYLKYKSSYKGKILTNAERMEKGLSPIEPKTGKAFELHHMGQKNKGEFVALTRAEHRGKGVDSILHNKNVISEIDQEVYPSERRAFWKAYVKMVK